MQADSSIRDHPSDRMTFLQQAFAPIIRMKWQNILSPDSKTIP